MAYRANKPTAVRPNPSMNSARFDFLLTDDVVISTGRTFKDPQTAVDWVNIQLRDSTSTGWVLAADVDQVPDPQRPTIEKEDFVRQSLIVERTFNSAASIAPSFVVADFLIARALFETDLTNAGPKIPGSDGIGPLQMSSQEWNAFLQNGQVFSDGFTPQERDWASSQIYGAAYRMHADGNAIIQANGAGFKPTYLDLFTFYLTKTGRAAGPNTQSTLANALTGAFNLIKQFAPDQIPPVRPDTNPTDPVGQKPNNQGAPSASGLNYAAAGIKPENFKFGDLIVDRFAKAGFSNVQQVAAVANACAESRLNPNANAEPGEHSYGLFQCNIPHGLGHGFTKQQLFDPETNTGIIIKEANKFSQFKTANTLDAAVAAFVKFIERPLDLAGQTTARQNIAHKL